MSDDSSNLVRLQKYIAECTNISRRNAEKLIVAGKVRLNGKVVQELGTKMDPSVDSLVVDNKPIKSPEKGVLLLHKPLRFITSRNDPQGRATVYELLSKNYQSYITVGRLDYLTSGLLIMTNDGDLANRLMHPSYNFTRTYRVLVQGSMPYSVLDRISRGVQLDDGLVQGEGKVLEQQGANTLLSLDLTEGRNRVVRRLMEQVGFPVLELKRVSFGPFQLGSIPVSKYEKLDQASYLRLRRQIFR